MSKTLPPDCRDCWFPQDYECTAMLQGKPFEPVYLPYMYFKVLRRLDEDTLEVNIGRRDMATDFHETFVRGKEYFDHYLAHQPVYLTLDKRILYEVKEIIPGAPMSWLLKKVPAAKVAATVPGGIIPMITVQPLNFGPLGGTGFERLVHAYVLQVSQGKKVQWLGEAGGDQGRDIWVAGNGRTTCYQCANYGRLTATKVTGDMDKLARHSHVPDHFILVCGGAVSAVLRDKVQAHGGKLGFGDIEVWSGTEFEERLRHQSPVILKRFAEGDPFPEVDGQPLASPVVAEADAAVLEFALAPVFALKGSDEELAVFLEEAFYRLEKGLKPAVTVRITDEAQLLALSVQTAAAPKTAANRQQMVWLRKIIDMLEEWKAEIAEKVEILYHTDCYPVNRVYTELARSLRQLPLLSLTPRRLYEETELMRFVNGDADYTEPAYKHGQTKVELFGDRSGQVGCALWLTKEEKETLLKKRTTTDQLANLSFWGFDGSDLSPETWVNKAIPSFVDKIYDYKRWPKRIESNDNSSWTHLPSYVLTLG
ncbi:MAG: hypothetical protein ACXVJB_00280 [Mucilaginibacter sp.]